MLITSAGSSADKLPLAGGVMAGDLLHSANIRIGPNTSDGADNLLLTLGHTGSTRGGTILIAGLEHANAGKVQLRAGNAGGNSLVEFLDTGDVVCATFSSWNGSFTLNYPLFLSGTQSYDNTAHSLFRTATSAIIGVPAGKDARARSAPTAVANATWTTITSQTGIVQGLQFALVSGMGSILMDWDGTTLTKLAGAATLVVAGSAGGTEVAFRVSGGNLQASNGTGASKDVSNPFSIVH